jgi:hypothetical protein
MERVWELLKRCGTANGVMPATALYNEGWMLRLLLDWFEKNGPPKHPLSFYEGARWYSEPLLSTQFAARTRTDPWAETSTHADGVIGHFELRDGRGDISLTVGGQQLVVAEAKMFSGLSSRTKRAEGYDQAARNVACIANLLSNADTRPDQIEKLAFYLIAPQSQWDRGVFGDLLDKRSIERKVRDRCSKYEAEKAGWLESWFVPTLEKIDVEFLSWEQLCADVTASDSVAGGDFSLFLESCIRYNRPAFLDRQTQTR